MSALIAAPPSLSWGFELNLRRRASESDFLCDVSTNNPGALFKQTGYYLRKINPSQRPRKMEFHMGTPTRFSRERFEVGFWVDAALQLFIYCTTVKWGE